MADLPNRTEYESQLSQEIAAILARNRAELENPALDAPKSERSLREKLLGLLALIFTLGAGTAAGELGIALVADGASKAWADSYGTWLARTVLTSVRKRISKAQSSDLTGEAGEVAKVLDQVTTPKTWENLAATEITRANTAGGEFTASVYNIGRMRLERGLPIIGQPITPDDFRPGELVPADAPQTPPDGPPAIPEPALALWHTSRDDKVCPQCRPLHGRPRDEWERVAPLGPPLHFSCRCFVDYMLEAQESVSESTRDGEEGVWRTIRGARVFIKDGKITKGPDALVGKSPDESERDDDIPSKPYTKRGSEMGQLFHGGPKAIKEIDPEMLQSRDSGYYGRGFYVADDEGAAKSYGGRITKVKLNDDALVLMSKLRPEEADKRLLADVTDHYIASGMERATARGTVDALRDEAAQIAKSPLAWKDAVDRFARDKGYDVVFHTHSEIVIKNLKVAKILTKRMKESIGDAEDWLCLYEYVTQLEAEEQGVWRTIRGAKVFIQNGRITKGPKALIDKTPDEAESDEKPKRKRKPAAAKPDKVKGDSKEKPEPKEDKPKGKVKQTETKEFKDWFGDSKVVDKDGKPLVVYHGTRKAFGEFNNATSGKAAFFTDSSQLGDAYSLRYGPSELDVEFDALRDRLTAQGVSKFDVHRHPEWKDLADAARERGANVIPAYLSIQNPLILDSATDSDRINAIKDSAEEIAKLKKQGYDGLIMRNAFDQPLAHNADDVAMSNVKSTVYAVFSPNQIKSATGNRGTFSRKSNRIDEQHHGA